MSSSSEQIKVFSLGCWTEIALFYRSSDGVGFGALSLHDRTGQEFDMMDKDCPHSMWFDNPIQGYNEIPCYFETGKKERLYTKPDSWDAKPLGKTNFQQKPFFKKIITKQHLFMKKKF